MLTIFFLSILPVLDDHQFVIVVYDDANDHAYAHQNDQRSQSSGRLVPNIAVVIENGVLFN